MIQNLLNMEVNIYNVIWADDECATLKQDELIRKVFNEKRIEVLEYVPTSTALRNALETYKDEVDAVVVDGNFSKEDVDYLESDDISGLIHTVSFLELYNTKRDIPFFLYTARKILLQDICKNRELDYFTTTKRLIQKGDIELLAEKIVSTVDHIHSIEFMVKKKYKALLNMAKRVNDDCSENLHQFLLNEARDVEYNRSISMFNDLRGILEQIMDLCKDNNIIPIEVSTLNAFKFYWSQYGYKNNNLVYKPNESIMPKAISHTIGNLIDVTQDGSHKRVDLNLQISEYVTEAQSPFMFRSCLYQVMDVVRWYSELITKLTEGQINGQNLYKITRIN